MRHPMSVIMRSDNAHHCKYSKQFKIGLSISFKAFHFDLNPFGKTYQGKRTESQTASVFLSASRTETIHPQKPHQMDNKSQTHHVTSKC